MSIISQQVNTRLPDALYQKLKSYADSQYIDVTTVIKMALVKFLDEVNTDSDNKK
ncbi:MAG: hypothetical protein RR710_04185 [Oscillospiraceae bacterium]